MKNQRGAIALNGVKPTKSLLRFVERQMEKWISRHQSLLFSPKDFDYSVTIDREVSVATFFHCSIDLRTGTHYWQAHEEGKTLQEALQRAILHLRSSFTQSPNLRPAVAYGA